MNRIFLDSASTTYCSDEVIEAMIPYFKENFGNPSSTHYFGRETAKAVNNARDTVAKSINAKPNTIYFTSSGTEGNNMAIFGIARANKSKGNHIITTKIEHQSIIDSAKKLEEKEDFKVTFLSTDKDGKIDLEELKASITEKTILISVMLVNNEVGTISDIKAISQIAKERGIIFHTDAVAGYGLVDIDVEDLGVDALTLSEHCI